MTREELLWQKLVDEAGEELIEQAAAVSVAQAERELAEAGFDVETERARAEAFLASLEGAAGTARAVAQAAPQEPPKRAAKRDGKRQGAVPVWVAAAAAAVTAGAAVAYVATRPEKGPAPSPTTPPSTTPPPTASPAPSRDLVAAAHDLRRRAAVACNAGRAEECLTLLDDAKKDDPAGDEAPEAKALRQRALRELEAKPK
jgi:hypothetical protein